MLPQCLQGEFDSNPTKASLFSQVYLKQVYFALLNTGSGEPDYLLEKILPLKFRNVKFWSLF